MSKEQRTTQKYYDAMLWLAAHPFNDTAIGWCARNSIGKQVASEGIRSGIIEQRGRFIGIKNMPTLAEVESLRRRVCTVKKRTIAPAGQTKLPIILPAQKERTGIHTEPFTNTVTVNLPVRTVSILWGFFKFTL